MILLYHHGRFTVIVIAQTILFDCHSMFKNAILTRSKNSYCPLDNTLIHFAYSTGCEMFTQQGTHCTGQSDGPDQRAYSETCPQVVAEHSSQT